MGFAICFNKFHDVEPEPSLDGDEFLENMFYFTEDILQIIKMELNDGCWSVPAFNNFIIDLGWYPDCQVSGQYKLVLATVKEDYGWDILREKVSTNRFEIRDTLEEWLQPLSDAGFNS